MQVPSTDPLTHLDALSADIGPRPATSAQERAAADYIADQLGQLTDAARTHKLWAPRSPAPSVALLLLISLGGIAMFLSDLWLAAGILVFVFVLLRQELSGRGFFWQVLPRRETVNITAVLRPKEEATRRLILACHHDSPVFGPPLAPGRIAGFRRGQRFALFSVGLAALVGITTLLWPQPLLLILLIPSGLNIAGTFVSYATWAVSKRSSPAAVSGAAGAAVVLAAAEELAKEPLTRTEVTVVSTGAKEAGAHGMTHYIDVFGRAFKGSPIIAVDSAGDGELVYTTSEGFFGRVKMDPGLVSLAERTGLARAGVNEILPSNAWTAALFGHKAIGIRAEGGEGTPPRYAMGIDEPDRVSGDALDKAVRLVVEMARAIDAEA